jgi:hypothetical protein
MIRQGHIEPFWSKDYQNYNYSYDPHAVDMETGWLEQGYHGFNLNGSKYVPSEFVANKFRKIFNWSNQGITFYKMSTMDALPLHQDHYANYIKLNKVVDMTKIHRGIIFLEDWQSGHYLEVENRAILNWQAGDWVSWSYDTLHYAANIGQQPRYTVQVTGICID